jgi:hypothetical protein
MSKLDLAVKYKNYYTAKAEPELVNIEAAQFLSITGKGNPSGKTFAEKIQALYSTAYAIKFNSKAKGQDFTVARLEGIWWFDEKKFDGLSMNEAPTKVPRSEWEYRLLIRLPHFISKEDVEAGIRKVIDKKQLFLANEIVLYIMEEGKSVQMLHIGPFDKEPETLYRINEFIKANKLSRNGLHHEIYLSDFRKVPPGKMRTILREPVC